MSVPVLVGLCVSVWPMVKVAAFSSWADLGTDRSSTMLSSRSDKRQKHLNGGTVDQETAHWLVSAIFFSVSSQVARSILIPEQRLQLIYEWMNDTCRCHLHKAGPNKLHHKYRMLEIRLLNEADNTMTHNWPYVDSKLNKSDDKRLAILFTKKRGEIYSTVQLVVWYILFVL